MGNGWFQVGPLLSPFPPKAKALSSWYEVFVVTFYQTMKKQKVSKEEKSQVMYHCV
jgi:hypothetical protein